MSIRIIGYSADEEAYLRHGGERAKKTKYKYAHRTQASLLKKNIIPGKFKCCYCAIPLDYDNYTREHVIPLIRGGKNNLKNIRPCCEPCNTEKGNLMPHTYLEWLILTESPKVVRVRQLFINLGVI